jgi:N-acyl-D-amino-acid deacylase
MISCDLIISGGTIVDGTGNPKFDGDVAIGGGRILEVLRGQGSSRTRYEAPRTIDASGRTVTPGFIDVHTHSDMTILANPQGESKIRQGVTTEIVGNCGFSAFPLRGERLKEERVETDRIGVDITWEDAEGYFAALESCQPVFNMLTFVGHGNIRGSVMGYEDRPPTPDELIAMNREVEIALDAGAIGLSTGLIYAPGIFAEVPEIIELQKVATARGGLYASHVRGEGDTLLPAADEFMAVVRGAKSQGQFSHLKASGPRNWGKVARVIEQIEKANEEGLQVRFDKYPYVASSTELASLLPRWVRAGGRDAAVERLADKKIRDRIIRESEQINEGKDGWGSTLLCEPGSERFAQFIGRTIADAGHELNMAGGEIFIDLLLESCLSTTICNFTMSQDETDAAILHPLGMVCSDASCRAHYGPLSHDCPHPRAYGTFGRYFRDYCLDRPLLTLEQAVHKVTELPCETFHIHDRGRVAAGYHADLLVLDFPSYRDHSKFADPHHYCTGLDAIVVNGVLTMYHGKHTGQRAGRVLRHGRSSI